MSAPGLLHSFHTQAGARWTEVGGSAVVRDYGSLPAEYERLRNSAALLDLGFRGRLCLTGQDRARYLHGQVTNSVQNLKPGEGCYAALVTAKGRMVSDLWIHCLRDELLLDFEPGYAAAVRARLDQFIIADQVEVIDVAPHYGLLSVLGPGAPEVIQSVGLAIEKLPDPGHSVQVVDPQFGEICCAHQPRGAANGFDLFVPLGTLETTARRLLAEVQRCGGGPVGWDALELLRVESGLPRFGQDMDESNLAPETGIEARAISYQKGCYIGQEIIARIRTYGQVTRALRGLLLPIESTDVPAKGAVLRQDGRDVGHVTSAVLSARLARPIALGYVRKECNSMGTQLEVAIGNQSSPVTITELPFIPPGVA